MRTLATALIAAVMLAAPAAAETRDWASGLRREAVPVKAWPEGRKVAICFVLYVETWGIGKGPTFRPDMVGRNPDLVDESFRRYAIEWGVPRVGRLFREQAAPLSVALNAEFPRHHPEVWKEFRATVPAAAIVAHGVNNSTDQLPLDEGVEAQMAYVRRTLDMIEQGTGVRPTGWSSPSVWSNAETVPATAAEGIKYSLDGMDSDVLTRLVTPSGKITMIPYPAVTVDMGQYLVRYKEPLDIERFWIDYIGELAREAEKDPSRPATVVAIGIHPFVVGTPAGAASLRRVLETIRKQKLVWITDVDAVVKAAASVP